jgi:hypothetical protein
MGVEYRVEFKLPPREEVDATLRGLPYFARFEEQYGNYEYRVPSNMDLTKMPDATMTIREWGLYLCDNLGAEQVFDALILGLFHYVRQLNQPFMVDNLE